MDISIIIVNYNSFNHVNRLIESIVEFTIGVSFEIVIVDNSNEAELFGELEKVYSFIQYFKSHSNIGFGRANNFGIKQAKGDFVLLLNADTIFVNNILPECIKYLNSESAKDRNVGVLGIKLLNEDKSFQRSFYNFRFDNLYGYLLSKNKVLFKLTNQIKYFEIPQKPLAVRDISGAFMFTRREVFKAYGDFDTDFFMYYEESDWCRNKLKGKVKIDYNPHFEIIHLSGGTSQNPDLEVQKIISQALFWWKRGKLTYICYLIILGVNYLSDLCLSGFKRKEREHLIEYGKLLLKSIPYFAYYIPGEVYKKKGKPLIYKNLIDKH